jgi:hypothetical protein
MGLNNRVLFVNWYQLLAYSLKIYCLSIMTSKTTNLQDNIPFVEDKNPENIQVCVRMRPLLEPFEDEVAWEVDNQNSAIKTRPDLKNTLDTNKLKALTVSHSRYYNELLHQQQFTFGKFIWLN